MFEFLKQSKDRITITDTLLERIKREELDKNSFVMLQVEIRRNDKTNKNQIFTGFLYSETARDPKNRIQITEADFEILKGGRLDFDGANILYFPDIDLHWKKTKKSNIHVVVANRKFSELPRAFEIQDLSETETNLKRIFQSAGVVSIFSHANKLSLEFGSYPLTKASEENLSEAILLEFTKWNGFIFR